MTVQENRKAFDLAEKEVNEKAVESLKLVIKSTLERINNIDQQICDLEKERKILKLDIEDFKEGRLDRIEERQQKDKKAEKVSVIKVIKEVVHEHHYDHWHQPYFIKINPFFDNKFYCSTNGIAAAENNFMLSGSTSKLNTVGTYSVNNSIVHLR